MKLPGPLVSVEWLQQRRDDEMLRLVDTRWYLGEPERGKEEYSAGHIPGARYADLERDLSARTGPGRHPLPAPDAFAATLGRLGIGNEHTVIVYDHREGAVAARLWWMLRRLGHDAVAVVDGGLAAWRRAGHPVTSDVPTWPASMYRAAPAYDGTVDAAALQALLGTVPVLDARSGDRYRGESEPIDPVAGHIPTAVNASFEGNLAHDGTFLPPWLLADRYRSLGVVTAGAAVVYCGSGVTACHDILAMEVAGLGRARLYPGSWSDWCTSGRPAAVGADPGAA